MIITFFILFIIIFSLVRSKDDDKKNKGVFKEANKVVYRDDKLPFFDTGTNRNEFRMENIQVTNTNQLNNF